MRAFGRVGLGRLSDGLVHYAQVLRRFPAGQIKEILFDKYDPGYRWRRRFAVAQKHCKDPVVLVPSAYQNVSRMAAAYAELLPAQAFLMVATRRSAHQFGLPENFQTRDLAQYAKSEDFSAEIASLLQRWHKLRAESSSSQVMRVLFQSGVLEGFGNWLRDGIHTREAWKEVLEREPVCGVLCGDDSNRYTRLPVLLAANRNIPTVDFHHGALDGHYLLKNLPSDIYFAKSEMERDYLLRVCGLPAEKVVLAPPAVGKSKASVKREDSRRSIVLFSEPYESAGLRADEVYRELLPALWKLAQESGRSLTIKLHPFESRWQRRRLVCSVLPKDAGRAVRIVDGMLTDELLAQIWFGITVESTVVIDCLRQGICCFLCGWMNMSPYEYAQQYMRFGVGELLRNTEEIREIPERLIAFHNRPSTTVSSASIEPEVLRQWLTSGSQEPCDVRSAS